MESFIVVNVNEEQQQQGVACLALAQQKCGRQFQRVDTQQAGYRVGSETLGTTDTSSRSGQDHVNDAGCPVDTR